MKCNAVHAWLLNCERPDESHPKVAAHLASCSWCRSWQQRLIRLEANLPLLSVPPATKTKQEFVSQFVSGATWSKELACAQAWSQESKPTNGAAGPPTLVDGKKIEKLAATLRSAVRAPRTTLHTVPASARLRFAVGLAAALLLVAVGLWSSSPPPFHHAEVLPEGRGTDPLLASLMQCDLRLASSKTAKERVEVLAQMAEELHSGTERLTQTADLDDLTALAKLYEQVVVEGIVKNVGKLAQSLPAQDRRRMLESLAVRLLKTSQAAEDKSRTVMEASSAPLHTIAKAAQEGNRQLLLLLKEGKS